MTLGNLENKLDIKPIKEEMNKLIKLDHEHNKRALNKSHNIWYKRITREEYTSNSKRRIK
jgi:hypothetical protein